MFEDPWSDYDAVVVLDLDRVTARATSARCDRGLVRLSPGTGTLWAPSPRPPWPANTARPVRFLTLLKDSQVRAVLTLD